MLPRTVRCRNPRVVSPSRNRTLDADRLLNQKKREYIPSLINTTTKAHVRLFAKPLLVQLRCQAGHVRIHVILSGVDRVLQDTKSGV